MRGNRALVVSASSPSGSGAGLLDDSKVCCDGFSVKQGGAFCSARAKRNELLVSLDPTIEFRVGLR